MKTLRTRRLLLALAAPVALSPFAFAQTNGQWTNNGNANWSATGSWLGSNIADGTGSIADFSQLNITGDRTVTIDGAVASRTIGTLLFGDTDSSHRYTIAASGGGTLTFNNGGTSAFITQGVNSGSNIISAPIVLADNLGVTNSSASLLTISGGITGTGNLTLNANSTGAITLSTGSINHTGTITNSGTGGGTTTISGVIGTNVTGVIQDSATSQLTLSGTNTFTTGVQIKQGTVLANSAAALGTGTLLLGDTTGSANATLLLNSFTVANPITVQSGGTGTLTIAGNGTAAGRLSGAILLNNNLTLEVAGGGFGGRSTGAFLATDNAAVISGTGNLNLSVSGALTTANDGGASQIDSLNVQGSITTTGSINNVGTGTGRAIISGNISNASSVNQDSATSQLTLSGTNTYSGATNVNAGVLRITANSALSANSSSVNVADGATLQLQNGGTALNAGQTLNISGHGTAYSQGAIESTNNANYAGNVVLQADSTVASDGSATTLTLSGTISGANRTLTTAGVGTLAISGNITTGTGGLVKEGTGTLNLSGTNTYTGTTAINNGAILLSSAGALGGGGGITFNGGAIRHSATNELDYGSRIVNSTGPVSIDTNGRNVTYSDIGASNEGGLLKIGTGRLTLSGTNTFSGPIVINNGVLTVSDTSAIPSLGTGQIFIDSNGALNNGSAYADVQAWLNSGNINTASTGAIALSSNTSQNIDFTGYSGLSLGASGNTTYTGTITPGSGGYRLGGGGATLTLSGTNALTGANTLAVNGLVTLTGANDLSGATTVNSGTLTLSGAGGLANSVVTVGQGTTLAVTTATTGSAVNRTAGVTLNRGILAVTGNATANSIDEIGALTIGSDGHSTLTINANGARNARVNADSFARTAGSTAVFRGQNLGVGSLGTPVNGNANLFFTTPNLVGNGGTGTDRSIFVGVVGSTATAGNGFGATGGLLTQDATNGVRLLSGSDYKTSITNGQSTLDNVQLTSTSGTATTTLTLDTTINSLSLNSTTATGANVQVGGTGKLTLNSGVIYANSVTATTASAISNTINFNGREGIILAGGSADLTLSGVLEGTGGNGLTVYAPSRTVTFSGASANTYTGTTTVNGGTLALNKTAGIDAIAGDLVVNTGATVSMSASNQIADTANVTLNGGNITLRNETVNNFSVLNGSVVSTPSNTTSITVNVNGDLTVSGSGSQMRNSIAGAINVAGVTNLSDGGVLTLNRSQNVLGNYDSVATLGGGLNITNTTSGAYTAINIGHGSGSGQSGAKLILGGDVTFTGNATNTNTVLIDAIKGSGRQGVIELTAAAGNRTFNIGNGAAATDLRITAALLDSSEGASGLIKTGLGTLELAGANTYTGSTVINAGTLALAASGSLDAASAITVAAGAKFDTSAQAAYAFNTGVATTIGVNGSTAGLIKAAEATFTGASLVFDFGALTSLAESYTVFEILGSAETGNFTSVSATGESISGLFLDAGDGLWTLASGSWTLTFNAYNGTLLTAVPEPSAFAALAGLATLGFVASRRRRRAA